VEEQELATPPRAFPMPFSQAIMDAVIPATFVGPKATFTGVKDPEAHLTLFHTQMMLTRGSDAVHCKMFMSTLTSIMLDWFVNLPDRHVTSFMQFFTLFREKYIANQDCPTNLLRSFQRKTISGRLPEGVPQSFWGTGGEAQHQG